MSMRAASVVPRGLQSRYFFSGTHVVLRDLPGHHDGRILDVEDEHGISPSEFVWPWVPAHIP
jgi:hypothetical protein